MNQTGWLVRKSYLDVRGLSVEGWIFTSPEGEEYPVFGFWEDLEPWDALDFKIKYNKQSR